MYENIGIIEKNGRRLIIDMAKYRGGFFWFDLTLKKPLVMFREFAIPATKVPETVAFCDENGYLLSKVTNDGEHLTPDYTRQWAQEILARAIVP